MYTHFKVPVFFMGVLIMLWVVFGETLEVYAQQKPTNKELRQGQKLLNKGEELVRVGEYTQALSFLEKFDELIPHNKSCRLLLGISYFHLAKYDKAKKALVDSSVFQEELQGSNYYYYVGKVYHLQNHFDSAISFYQKALTLSDELSVKQDVERLIAQCGIGKTLIAKPKNVEKFNLGSTVNSAYPDFAPVLSADESQLFFTSRRPNQYHPDRDPVDNMPYEDIYISEKKDDGTWGKPTNLAAINTEDHDASIGISPDGNTLFIYRGETTTSGQTGGNIYYTQFSGGKWHEPKSMQKGVNSRSQETHATIIADETLLMIASDRNDQSIGGKDIFMVRRLPDLTWAKPENLGAVINSKFDEDSPYITADGKTLYFSSNGPKSMGGYDIFYAHFDAESQTWSEPINMGYPINTAGDDIFIVWSADGTRGYFSSKKEKADGGQDLYMLMLPEEKHNLVAIKGKVIDRTTQKPTGSTIEIVNNETHEVVQIVQSNNYTGKFSAHLPPGKNYGVRVSKKGYLFESLNVYVPNQFEYLEIIHDFELKRMEHNQVGQLNNVFFNENAEILEDSYPELLALKKLIEESPQFQIEVAVHSDDTQDSLVNLLLTKAQAENITYHLERLGASEKIVSAKSYGFGSLFPIATNETRLGRIKNNRVEYIVREVEDTSALDYTTIYAKMEVGMLTKGECVGLEELTKQVLKPAFISFNSKANILNREADQTIRKIVKLMDDCPDLNLMVEGYGGDEGTDKFRNALSLQLAGLVAQKIIFYGIDEDRISIGKQISEDKDGNDKHILRVSFRPREEEAEPVLAKASTNDGQYHVDSYLNDAIYFQHDSDSINSSFVETLEKIISILQANPTMNLLIEGHCDATGAAAYNMKLSIKRAKKVLDALIQAGIASERLTYKGYGESKAESASPVGLSNRHNRKCVFLITAI